MRRFAMAATLSRRCSCFPASSNEPAPSELLLRAHGAGCCAKARLGCVRARCRDFVGVSRWVAVGRGGKYPLEQRPWTDPKNSGTEPQGERCNSLFVLSKGSVFIMRSGAEQDGAFRV